MGSSVQEVGQFLLMCTKARVGQGFAPAHLWSPLSLILFIPKEILRICSLHYLESQIDQQNPWCCCASVAVAESTEKNGLTSLVGCGVAGRMANQNPGVARATTSCQGSPNWKDLRPQSCNLIPSNLPWCLFIYFLKKCPSDVLLNLI